MASGRRFQLSITARVALGLAAVAALTLNLAAWFAGPTRSSVVIGYQTGVDPTKLAQAQGAYAAAIGRPVVWRKFDSGTDVITALASGDIDFGDLGSSVAAVAATRQLPISAVVLIAQLGRSEALVVRNGAGIRTPADLIGKRIAVPFVSTSHYSLLAALHHWGIAPGQVRIVNLSPPQMTAAWARGDIDAGYVWDPALGFMHATGTVLAGSDDVARWGAPTYDLWVVRREFARSAPQVVAGFVKATLASEARYRREGANWSATSPQVATIAGVTGSRPQDVPGLLAGNIYPDAAEQASTRLLGGRRADEGLARDLRATAAFLKAQGKVDRVLDDYTPWIDSRWVAAAAGHPPATPSQARD